MKIYTVGYSGKRVADLVSVVLSHNVMLVDIRFSPRSMNPDWSRKRLIEKLGSHYIHEQGFGNVNYKEHENPFLLKDFDAGLIAIKRMSTDILFLMCGCSDPHKCHRTYIASKLRFLGFDVSELLSFNTLHQISLNL